MVLKLFPHAKAVIMSGYSKYHVASGMQKFHQTCDRLNCNGPPCTYKNACPFTETAGLALQEPYRRVLEQQSIWDTKQFPPLSFSSYFPLHSPHLSAIKHHSSQHHHIHACICPCSPSHKIWHLTNPRIFHLPPPFGVSSCQVHAFFSCMPCIWRPRTNKEYTQIQFLLGFILRASTYTVANQNNRYY